MIHILMFIAGCCIGSFINVVLSRRDWYRGRSRCDHCGYVLKWYDLVPIVSFVCLGGKCRNCWERIEPSHIMSELFMGGAFLCSSLVIYSYGIWYGTLCFVSLFFIAVAAIEDFKEQMVYSCILSAGIVSAYLAKLCVCIKFAQVNEAVIITVSVIMIKGLVIILSRVLRNKIGEGDFDILIIMYILCGVYNTVLSVVIACVLGIEVYLPHIIMKKRDKNEPLPLVPFLLAGTICNMLL